MAGAVWGLKAIPGAGEEKGVPVTVAAPSEAVLVPGISSRDPPDFCNASPVPDTPLGAAAFSRVDVFRIASSTGLLTDSVAAWMGSTGGGGAGDVGSSGAGAGVAGLVCLTGLFSASLSAPQMSVSAPGSAVVIAATSRGCLCALRPMHGTHETDVQDW